MAQHILSFLNISIYLCMAFWLCWVFAACRLSLAVVDRGYTLTVVCLHPIAVTSLVAEHRL